MDKPRYTPEQLEKFLDDPTWHCYVNIIGFSLRDMIQLALELTLKERGMKVEVNPMSHRDFWAGVEQVISEIKV